MRRRAGAVIIALALLAVSAPQAAAQPPARPEPEELWQQFPLDSARSDAQAPAERGSAPRTSPSANRSTAERGNGSLSTVQIAAIAVAMGLLLLVATGVLAYTTWARIELGIGGVRPRPWTPRAGMHPIADSREPTVPADKESAELAALEEILGTYVAPTAERTADEELVRLKAKLDMHPASTSSPADYEREVLKAKRDEPAGSPNGEHPDEVETLKAKLATMSRGAGAGRPRR